jgi:hypothetical protein
MKRCFAAGLILSSVFLTGCLESAYRMGAPISERGHSTTQNIPETTPREAQQKSEPVPISSEVERDQEVQIAIYTPPPRFKAKPVTSAAVSNLVQTAMGQKDAGDMVGAAATMERALRIEPRNAHLWNQLAEVRLRQRQYSQAEDLAAKSNALAAADRGLRRKNWLLIAKARRSVGNIAGARFAENKANVAR